MTIISNYFDYLHFTECEFESFKIPNDGREKIHNERNNERKDYEFENSKIRNPYSPLNNQQNTYRIIGAEIVIVTHKIGIIPGHPLNKTDDVIFLPQCNLIFKGVKRSVRHVTRYVEELSGPNQFKSQEARKETIDVLLPDFDGDVKLFEIEVILKNPLRWVDWEIESLSFGLEVSTAQETLSQNYSKSVSGERGKS